MATPSSTLDNVTPLGGVGRFLARTSGQSRLDIKDFFTYAYLILGTLVMFGPVLWLVLSSFKDESLLFAANPTFLPYRQESISIEGYDEPLPLFDVNMPDGSVKRLAQINRVGINARMLDPENPTAEPIVVNIREREIVREVYFSVENYTGALDSFNFWLYLRNTVVVTVAATLVTLLINSMAAFALSKYRFVGRDFVFLLIISTLMVPVSVILIPAFLVISQVGWVNTLWGLIIPGAATPTGVFLLRQYMLTIPDELIDAARIDGASEWRIYWQVILPLAAPALAVLAIFSVMWRWNDFLWPLIVVSRNELFTLQVGLNSFQGALTAQWHYILAMTVLSLLPITVIFAILQRFITSGIATTGLK